MTAEITVDTRICDSLPIKTASQAAAEVPENATVLVSGFGSVGYPKAVPIALAESDRNLALTIVSGGSVGPEIDEELVETDAVIRRFPYQGNRNMRTAVNRGSVAFHDRNISTVGDEVRFGGLVRADVAIVEAVAVGEDWFIPSTSIGQTPSFADAVDSLIVEVNRAQPLALQLLHDNHCRSLPPYRKPITLSEVDERIGTPEISFDPESLVAVVETDVQDNPYEFRSLSETDEQIASNLTTALGAEIEQSPIFADQVNIQFGVGSLGNALMASLQDFDVGDKELAYFGEVIQDGLLDMLETGVVKRASAASLALSKRGRTQLFENFERFARSIVLRPASVSNDPGLINQLGVIAVNSALEVDIYGHVNSTHVNGRRMVNGIGGSGDYSRNSPLAIIALPSTAKEETISRVVPMVPHVDHTEHDIQLIVTEQGVADLRGLSPLERADSIISNCAHPSFQPQLSAYVERASKHGGHIAHDLQTAFNWN